MKSRRPRLSLVHCCFLAGALLLALPSNAETSPSPEELWNAAREGDLATVDRLLGAGLDVDSPNRYGATALSFAAQNGQLEVVRRLLEAGAQVDVTDTFYQVDPLGWAAQGGHLEVAELLLDKGADAEAALLMGIFTANEGIALAAIRHGVPLPSWTRDDALRAAQMTGLVAVADALAEAEVDATVPTVEPSDLSRFVGPYEADAVRVEVELVEGVLRAKIRDQEPVALVQVDDEGFRVADDLSRGLSFYGRSETVEGLFLFDGPMPLGLTRAEDDVEEAANTIATTGESGTETGGEETAAPVYETEIGPRSAPLPWPQFRGEGARGLADGQGVPPSFDLESGTNVRFKVEIPGLALSSPVVWGDRIYLTTAVAEGADTSLKTGLYGDVDTIADSEVHEWQVMALDKGTGEVLWKQTVGKAVPLTERHTKSSQANSTPATDGRYVVSVFPTAGLAVHTVEGELKWHEDLGGLNAGWFYDEGFEWGFASSPILWRDQVILQVDVHGGAYIAAWNVETGERLWTTERDEIPTWATPTVIGEGEAAELVTNGSTIRGYDPRTGHELWTLGPNSEVIIATPFEADGLVYATAGYPPVRPIYAVRPGGRGDLSLPEGEKTSDQIAWSINRGGAYMPTPIAYRGILYFGHHDGRLAAYHAASGQRAFRARFSAGGTFTGSPVATDGRLYFPTEDGQLYVLAAGPEYRELAVVDFGEPLMTTPAISDGLLLIRGSKHLWGIGAPATPSSEGP